MPTIGKPKPRFLKLVSKPANVGNVELSKAEPVYIDGLPEGGGGSSTTAGITIEGIPDAVPDGMTLNDFLMDFAIGMNAFAEGLETRVAALESAAG